MFGTDEHSVALLGQWRKAKKLRDPAQVAELAKTKGLTLTQAMTLDTPMYHVRADRKSLFYGTFEDAAKFIDEYTLVSQPYPAFAAPPLGKPQKAD